MVFDDTPERFRDMRKRNAYSLDSVGAIKREMKSMGPYEMGFRYLALANRLHSLKESERIKRMYLDN